MFIICCIGLLIISFGFVIQIFEKAVIHDDENTSDPFDSTWNPMWLVILTMTTVGYGEFVPETHVGRLFTMIACFAGTFIISLITVTITQKISMNDKETNAFEFLMFAQNEELLMREAADVIKVFWKYIIKKRRIQRKISIIGKVTLNDFQ